MAAPNIIKKTFEDTLTRAGFTKKSGEWYSPRQDTIAVLELQKSNYGPQYYVNVAFWLRALGDERFPPERLCHIRARIEQLVSTGHEQLETLLDLEQPVEEADRARGLRHFLENELLPLVDGCSTIEGLKGPAGERLIKSSLIRIEAQALLSIPPRSPPPGR